MTEGREAGLRESKKRQIREQIRASAVALFAAQGYHDTTMEQIAAAAQVAPRTVYRYFPTKDTLVITDEDDERMLARFREELREHTPVQAIRRAYRGIMLVDPSGTDDIRGALIAAEPELQAANLRFITSLADRYADAIVEATGRPEDADAARDLAGAAAGIALVTIRWTTDQTQSEQFQRLDAALDRLEHGFADAFPTRPPAE